MTLEKPTRALWAGHDLEPRPQFHEKTPREKERTKFAAADGKNSAKFWTLRPSGLHPSGVHPSGPHSSRLHFFWVWAHFRPPPLDNHPSSPHSSGLHFFWVWAFGTPSFGPPPNFRSPALLGPHFFCVWTPAFGFPRCGTSTLGETPKPQDPVFFSVFFFIFQRRIENGRWEENSLRFSSFLCLL